MDWVEVPCSFLVSTAWLLAGAQAHCFHRSQPSGSEVKVPEEGGNRYPQTCRLFRGTRPLPIEPYPPMAALQNDVLQRRARGRRRPWQPQTAIDRSQMPPLFHVSQSGSRTTRPEPKKNSDWTNDQARHGWHGLVWYEPNVTNGQAKPIILHSIPQCYCNYGDTTWYSHAPTRWRQ
ncbi:hypothetical protein EDB82DRAFT_572581 [Fusarium venenatum]|uniref:uncharacterized protein n=1 Tax=Fusarium venenatum TaxID=56646 RepID=UPI001D8DA20D|nr:hypothetical protein EDB82DRAFT_572581 [Fusarium venenatum]